MTDYLSLGRNGSGELNFDDIEPIEIPFSVAGRKYVLKEGSGDAAAQYRNKQLAATRLGPNGKPVSFQGLADADLLLVSLCVQEILPDGKQKPVGDQAIRSWPNRITKRLVDKAKEITELEDSEDALDDLLEQRRDLDERIEKIKRGSAKNEQESTPVGSG